jgi:hypothetical protein
MGRGKCYGCRGRFESHDVPKHVRMADGVMRKVCRGCNNRMGNLADVPRNVVNKKQPVRTPKPKKKNGKERPRNTQDWFY